MATIDNADEELILFQCKKCNNIITDSSNSDGANADMGIIILQEFPVTLRHESSIEDGQGNADECSYYILNCSSCGATLGKLFQSVPEELSELSDRATLEIKRLQFYTVPSQLHSSKLSHISSQETREPEMKKSLTRQEDENSDSLKFIRSDIQKMQFVMCHFDERIGRIEKMLQLPDMEEDIPEESGVSLLTSESTTSKYQSSLAVQTVVIPRPPRPGGGQLISPSSTTNLVDRLSVIERNLESRKGSRKVSRYDSKPPRDYASNGSKSNNTVETTRKSSVKKRSAEQLTSPERKKQRKDFRGKFR